MRWVTGITLSKHKCALCFYMVQDCALDIKESLQRTPVSCLWKTWLFACTEAETVMCGTRVSNERARERSEMEMVTSCLSRKLRDEGQRSPNSLTWGCGHFLKKKKKKDKLNYWVRYVYKCRWHQIRNQTTFLGWVQRNSPTVSRVHLQLSRCSFLRWKTL